MDNIALLHAPFAYALGLPATTSEFKSQPGDFVVNENLDISFTGEGEHHYLHVQKTGENTPFIANELARFLKIKPLNISFSGMKDRHAITSQWYSVQLPGKDLDLNWDEFVAFSGVNAHLIATEQHNKKLRRGAHSSNDFVITLRHVQQSDDLDARLHDIAQNGVPNYFGFQRFGRNNENLVQANAWLLGKTRVQNKSRKSLYMSSARAFLFNVVLSARVKERSWQTPLSGEPDMLHATAPLWGRGHTGCKGDALLFEQTALIPFAAWCDKMEHLGLNQERRPLVLKPQNFSWIYKDDTLVITMRLQPGQFATAVLREITQLNQPAVTAHTTKQIEE